MGPRTLGSQGAPAVGLGAGKRLREGFQVLEPPLPQEMGGSSHREVITDDGAMRTVGCMGHTAAVVYMGPHARRIAAELQDKVWAASCPLLSIFPLTGIAQEGIGPLAYKLHANRGFYRFCSLLNPQH